MKAITTRFCGPTETRGARMSAMDEDSNRVTIPYPVEAISHVERHARVVREFCKRFGLNGGTLIGGSMRKGMVWVWNWPGADRVEVKDEAHT